MSNARHEGHGEMPATGGSHACESTSTPNPLSAQPAEHSAAQVRWNLARAIHRDDSEEVVALLERCSQQGIECVHLSTDVSGEAAAGDEHRLIAKVDDALRSTFPTNPNLDSVKSRVFVVVAMFNSVSVAKRLLLLLGETIEKLVLMTAFNVGCQCGHNRVVELFLAHARVDGAEYFNSALWLASKRGQESVVKLLLTDRRADPSSDDNYAIRYASRYGHDAVVKLLLADPRADPAAKNNQAIRHATRYGDATVVQLLLADPRVDPSTSEAFQLASQHGHATVVQLLLADPRVDPAVQNNFAIAKASELGQVVVVKLLLADPRVDPAVDESSPIRKASKSGQVDVVKLLLADPRVDPAAVDNYAIRKASALGQVGVVKMLLADPRVDATTDRNFALRTSSKNGYSNVVEVLLADPRVITGGAHNQAMYAACANGRTSIARQLVAHDSTCVTTNALVAAADHGHLDVIRMCIEDQPRLVWQLLERNKKDKDRGLLRRHLIQSEVRRWEARSTLTLLLSLGRRSPTLRLSDVLRDVAYDYARFGTK
jgi:ankyrin repeat protein